MGAQDPHFDTPGQINFCLGCQLAGYHKANPPPHQVQPIPIQILQHLNKHYAEEMAQQCAICNLIWIAFFFLLCPGEYCHGGSNGHFTPFHLCDIQFFAGQQMLNIQVDIASLGLTDFASLTFNDQKNGVKGEAIGHGASGQMRECAVNAL